GWFFRFQSRRLRAEKKDLKKIFSPLGRAYFVTI
ncbi:Hcp1 family type VI secretion system effector, partial [Escherichia coli]